MTREQRLELILRLALEDNDKSLDLDHLDITVITAGTTLGSDGHGNLVRSKYVSYFPFDKGEIIVQPSKDYGSSSWPAHRDIITGRSTSKYDVCSERFGWDWEAAKRRSDEIKAAPDKDGFA